MKLLEGKKIADRMLDKLADNIRQSGLRPVFAAVLVGDDPASHIYVNLKEKAAERVGIDFRKIILPESIVQEDLLREVRMLNDDTTVHGILVQLPLPEKFETQAIIDAIDPRKDVDGFHPENIRLFLENKENLTPVFPRAIMELIRFSDAILAGKRAVVIGNSDIFGQMMLSALSREGISGEFIRHASLECCRAQVLAADIVVSACGIPKFITSAMLKSGAIVIDGGIAKVGDMVVGDVDRESVSDKDIWLSPVPGGVGPVTIACLLENVYKAVLLKG